MHTYVWTHTHTRMHMLFFFPLLYEDLQTFGTKKILGSRLSSAHLPLG